MLAIELPKTDKYSLPACMLSRFSCVPILCDPMDGSPPGSSVHGIHQTRIVEWVAISSPRGSSRPKDQTCVSYVFGFSRLFQFGAPFVLGLLSGTRGEEVVCQCRRLQRCGFHPWVWKIPLKENGNPLQYSCLENSTDRGAW